MDAGHGIAAIGLLVRDPWRPGDQLRGRPRRDGLWQSSNAGQSRDVGPALKERWDGMIGGAAVGESLARGVRTGCGIALAAVLAVTAGLPIVSAQQKQAPAQAPAKKAEPAAKQEQASAWVKLCEAAPVVSHDKDGKEIKEAKNICLTHHERLDGNTGMVLVSAAIRQTEGNDKQHLMVMVPLGMAIHPGLRATIYSKDEWDQAQKSQKFEDNKSEPIKLSYALCHPAGCTAEVETTKEMIAKFKTGGGVMVLAINAAGQVVAFPIPLTGFVEAYDGKPVDNQKYSEARKALMMQIAQRQQQMMEEYKKQQEAAKAGGGAQGQQTPSAAPAAKAPEKKK
jgi:invasion protein IalB